MINKKLAVIGAGHIGTAIIKGLVNANKQNTENIIATNIKEEPLKKLQEDFNVQTTTDNITAVRKSDWVIVAVKPGAINGVLQEIKEEIKNKILISVAAGITLNQLEEYLQNKAQKIVRIMPNIPISVNSGVIGFLANDNVEDVEKEEMESIFSQLGKVYVAEAEEDFIFFGLTPGCGPALVSYCISMFGKTAEKYGFNAGQSEEIAMQIFQGTLKFLAETKQTPEKLQQAVATKGGVTERILQSLDEQKFTEIFEKAIEAGRKKTLVISNKVRDLNSNE